MSTFQHTIHSTQRTRMILLATAVAAVLAVTVALVASNSTTHPSLPSVTPSTSGHVTQAEAQRQLQSVSGARSGTVSPTAKASSPQDPKSQLESVAGARYGLRYTAR